MAEATSLMHVIVQTPGSSRLSPTLLSPLSLSSLPFGAVELARRGLDKHVETI